MNISLLNIKIRIMKRKYIILTASSIAATYSGISGAFTSLHFLAKMEIVAVLLYKPPTMPETKIPDW